MNYKSFRLVIVSCMLFLLLVGSGGRLAAAMAENTPDTPLTLAGRWTVLWGDGINPTTGTGSTDRFTLTDDAGRAVMVRPDAPLAEQQAGLQALDRQRVQVTGQWQTLANGSQVLLAQSVQATGKTAPDDVLGPQPWVSLLCKFDDVATEPKDLAYFLGMFASTFPGLDHYWREQSFDLINMLGSSASDWRRLPRSRSYYVYDGALDFGRAASDCTAIHDSSVYFPSYKGINLMFNADLDGYAWGGQWYLCLDGLCQNWSMTWEPPGGYANIGVIAHENGHGLGLPHSSGMYGQTYDNAWDVMSDLWNNCSLGGVDPIYGCLAQHTISYHKDLLGWIPAEQSFVAGLGTRRTITLERLALPQTENYLIAQIPINGAPDYFYTVEARLHAGYDSYLPGDGVIIHEVVIYRDRPAQVLDIDGNGDTGDEGAMWRVGESFVDSAHGITVTVVASTTTGFIVTIENQPQPPSQVTIRGPQSGAPQVAYTFTADVLPAETTLPVTYTWQVGDQQPVTHTAGLSDTATFRWDAVGTYTVTVQASNPYGSVTDSHVVVIDLQPVEAVTIAGPELVWPQMGDAFTAAVSPITATQPVTYVWQAAGQPAITHTGGLSDTAIFTWSTPGPQMLTVTAINANGVTSATHELLVGAPPAGITLSGPLTGTVDAAYTFTALVTPTLTTVPLTYTWQISGQLPVTRSAGLSDTLALTWAAPGTYTLTVTARNGGGTVTGSLQMTILAAAPKIYLPLVMR